jgi:hypothetical protein
MNMERQIHPAAREILQYFEFRHLKDEQRLISEPFHNIAHEMANTLEGPELTAGLRKLLEAKDCFVRASLPKTT